MKLLTSLALLCISPAPITAQDISGPMNCALELFGEDITNQTGGLVFPTFGEGSSSDGYIASNSDFDVSFIDAYPIDKKGNQTDWAASTTKTIGVTGKHLVKIYKPILYEKIGLDGYTDFQKPWLLDNGYLDPNNHSNLQVLSLSALNSLYFSSAAFCSWLGHALFHESLHAKLFAIEEQLANDGDPDTSFDATSDCAHIAVSATAALKSCEKATTIAACIQAIEDDMPLPGDCPDQEAGETSEEYLQRLKDLKSGLCGSIDVEREAWNDREQTALCCFCETTPPDCPTGPNDGPWPWENPCPVPTSVPPGDPPPPGIHQPEYTPDQCDGSVPLNGEVIPACDAC